MTPRPTHSSLLLPFRHRATIKPTSRSNGVEHWLRDDCFVDVPHLEAGDFAEAIVITSGPEAAGASERVSRCTYLERSGRLFQPITQDGDAMSVDAFVEFLKEPKTIRKGDRPHWHRGYRAAHAFPTPRMRFDARSGANPLNHWSLGALCLSEGWTMARKEFSDETIAAGDVARHLSEALAIVDGIVYAECPEPVWHCRKIEGRAAEIRLSSHPVNLQSPNCFRLDQEQRARAWARSRRWTIVEGEDAPRVDIRTSTAVQRQDLVEITRTVLWCWPYMRGWCRRHGIEILGKGGHAETLDRARAEQRPLLWPELGVALDAVSEIRRTFAAGMRCRDGSYGGRPDAIDATVKRWAFERPGYDPDLYDRLNESDIDALQGIEFA